MDFQEAIRKIEERGDFNRYAEVRPIFVDRLDELRPGDHTERGICNYYLLASYLKAQLVHETAEAISYYEAMDDSFMLQLEVYRDQSHKFSWSEIQDFFRLIERCYGSLEFLYLKHDFKIRKAKAHLRKMEFRKDGHFFNREYWSWFEYKVLEITSLYTTSIVRWATTTFGFAVFMACFYAGLDQVVQESMRTIAAPAPWYDYLYFSVMTMTTVGFGDITPVFSLAKLGATFEAFLGFLMLGIFISLIQKKL
ncbi:MAG: hypothetical protein ACI9QC_000662 [Oceanicoccus sp.]|jgi:hypothetical protein